MTNNLIIELIARLNAVDNFTFFVIAHTRNHCNGFVKVDIEVLSFCLNFSYAERFERLVKLVENNLYTFLDSIYVFCFVSNGAFEVVKNRQESTNSLLATIEQKLRLLYNSSDDSC